MGKDKAGDIMSLKCRDIINLLEKLAHPKHAEAWDNVGLQIGSPEASISKILVTLDLNLDVVLEAINSQVDMIIVHHTPFFKPVDKILWNTPQGAIIQKLINHNINLYCAHTNLDSCWGGVNDVLADLLGLREVQVLAPSWQEKYFKLVVFVPVGYEDKVREALGAAGAGWIGMYSDCSFQLLGTGTFKPLEGADPFIGKKGQLEKVEEYRLETIVPNGLLKQVIDKMLLAHPYEEVAYDLYPLANSGAATGLGRIGILEEEKTLLDIIYNLKEQLKIENLRYVGDLKQGIKRIALCGGSGASLIKKAALEEAQLYITGDIKYHEAQEAEKLGLALIDAGHYATEHPIVESLVTYLTKNSLGKVEIIASQINTDPFKFI